MTLAERLMSTASFAPQMLSESLAQSRANMIARHRMNGVRVIELDEKINGAST